MSDTKTHLTNPDTWLHVLLVFVFALIFYVAAIVLGLVVLINLIALLITGKRNEELSDFGQQTSDYIRQIMEYATLNRSERPFPFGQWPDSDEDEPASTPQPEMRSTARPPEPPPAQDVSQTSPSVNVRPPARTAPPEPAPLKSTTAGRSSRKTTARKKTTRKKRSTKKTTAKGSGSDQS